MPTQHPSYSPATRPSSVSKSPFASFSELKDRMFNCGGCTNDVYFDDAPMMYNQASYEDEEEQSNNSSSSNYNEPIQFYRSACNNVAEDDESFYNDHVVNNTQTYRISVPTQREPAEDYFNRIKDMPPMNKLNGAVIPISPITSQQQRQQSISSFTSSQATTQIASNRTSSEIFKKKKPDDNSSNTRLDIWRMVLPTTSLSTTVDKSPSPPPKLKQSNSNCTQSTVSMSESDDEMSTCSLNNEMRDEQESKEKKKPVIGILRRKRKLGSTKQEEKIVQVSSSMGRVKFVKDTKFADPNAPLAKRKAVPRLTPKQRQEYALNAGWLSSSSQEEKSLLNNNGKTTVNLSPLLIAASPSLVIKTSNRKSESSPDPRRIRTMSPPKRAASPTKSFSFYNNCHVDSETRRLERMERRMGQRQHHHHHYSAESGGYLPSSHSHHHHFNHYNHNNNNNSGFYAFR